MGNNGKHTCNHLQVVSNHEDLRHEPESLLLACILRGAFWMLVIEPAEFRQEEHPER